MFANRGYAPSSAAGSRVTQMSGRTANASIRTFVRDGENVTISESSGVGKHFGKDCGALQADWEDHMLTAGAAAKAYRRCMAESCSTEQLQTIGKIYTDNMLWAADAIKVAGYNGCLDPETGGWK